MLPAPGLSPRGRLLQIAGKSKAFALRILASVLAVLALATAGAGILEGGPGRSRSGAGSPEATGLRGEAVALEAMVAPLWDSLETAARVEVALARLSLPTGGDSSHCLSVTMPGGLKLYERNATQSLKIASITKLFTTATALFSLGTDFRFETRLVLQGDASSDGRVVESAVLVGSGDPFLVSSEFEGFWLEESKGGPVTRLEELAEQVAASGIRSIETLYADASLFDSQAYPKAVPPALLEQRLLPPVSALSVDRNITSWQPDAGLVEFAENPPHHAASRLAQALRMRGVAVGRVAVREGQGPLGRDREFVVRSAPLLELAAYVNSRSDNFAAEMLAKRLAASDEAPGSWEKFSSRVTEVLGARGVSLSETRLEDGSGLSGNASSCRDVTSLVRMLWAEPDASALVRALPSPGSPGTLQQRFTELPSSGRLHAKTGSLRDVSALAGIVDTGESSAVVFSVLVNGEPIAKLRSQVEDAAVARLLEPAA